MNLYNHAKNQVISSFYSRDIFSLKILQLDWPRAFWPISQEPDFSQIWNLCMNIANNILANDTFIVDQIREKLMTKFFKKFENPIFDSFSPFLGKIYFIKKNFIAMHIPI